jgi:hypothetical protein
MHPDRAKEIRAAVERGEFARARVLWEEWTDGPLTIEEWASAQELYHWSRNILLSEKAHLLHQKNNLHAAAAYLHQNRY